MQTRSSPSIATLHSLARRVRLRGYHALSKSDLYTRLRENYDFSRLLRAQCRSKARADAATDPPAPAAAVPAPAQAPLRRSATPAPPPAESKRASRSRKRTAPRESEELVEAKKLKSCRAQNKLDPIMFTRLGKKKFKFVRPNGTALWYDIETLNQYLIISGEFREPETRIDFSMQDLRRLDQQAKHFGLKLPSVVEAKADVAKYAEKRLEEEAVGCLERLCGEVVSDMQRSLETHDPEALEILLVGKHFPSYSHFFKEIKDRDPERATSLVRHYMTFLRGPPNRLTEDPFGFMPVIEDFIEDVSRGARSASEFGF